MGLRQVYIKLVCKNKIVMHSVFPASLQILSHDALRMRLTRLCQKRKGGTCHVDEGTHNDWASGGEKKEWLELALLEVLKEVGTDAGPAAFKIVKAYAFEHLRKVFRGRCF